jgi:hypothetical protein
MAIAAALILWLERGATFNHDQMGVLLAAPDLGLREVFQPRAGHLGATATLVYKGTLEAFGSGNLAFRITHVVVVLVAAGAFYALVKRRVGALAALAPTLVVLFLGADWAHVATQPGFTVVFSVATGLGSLLALERNDRLGDAIACLLVIVSVLTFSTGLAFLAGVTISVLLAPDRWRRAWIFAVPATLYLAWWLWALSLESSSSGQVELADVLLMPAWLFQSLAAVLASIAGIAYDFRDQGRPEVDPTGGAVLALVAAVALIARIRRGAVPPMLWTILGIALAYWGLQALASAPGFRYPSKYGYMYPGAVIVLLALTTALAATRLMRRGLVVLLVITAYSLAANVATMGEGASYSRQESSVARAQFAMLELGRSRIEDPSFNPEEATPGAAAFSTPADQYYAFVERYGSPAPSIAELRGEDEEVRERADRILAGILRPTLRSAAPGTPVPRCERHRSATPTTPIELELAAGRTDLRSDAPASVGLGRFADVATHQLGALPARQATTLRIPPDADDTPWHIAISGASSVWACRQP